MIPLIDENGQVKVNLDYHFLYENDFPFAWSTALMGVPVRGNFRAYERVLTNQQTVI
jgi:hypothetical protein